jgi:hypothetical protein
MHISISYPSLSKNMVALIKGLYYAAAAFIGLTVAIIVYESRRKKQLSGKTASETA